MHIQMYQMVILWVRHKQLFPHKYPFNETETMNSYTWFQFHKFLEQHYNLTIQQQLAGFNITFHDKNKETLFLLQL